MSAEIDHTPSDFSYSIDSEPTDTYDIRHFYDPAEKFRDDPLPAFLGRVAATRAVEVKMMVDGRMQELRPREVMAAELTHALIDVPEELAAGNDVAERGIQEVVAATHEYADLVATTAVQLAEQIKKNRKSKESVLVLAAQILAATAHETQKRNNGEPYIEHPDQAASMFEIAWREHIPQNDETDLLLDINRFLIYQHDGYEDGIDSTGEYLAQDKKTRFTVSPLIALKVLEKCGIESPSGHSNEHIGRNLLFMTHRQGFENTKEARMAYDDFTQAGAEQGGMFYLGAKPSDTAHNTKIQPPQDPNKLGKYTKSINHYKQEAQKYGAPFARVVKHLFELTPEKVRNFKPGGFELKHIPPEFRGMIAKKIQERRKKK